MKLLIPNPMTLTVANWASWVCTGRLRVSGKVHKRFQVKLLTTAAEKEMELATSR